VGVRNRSSLDEDGLSNQRLEWTGMDASVDNETFDAGRSAASFAAQGGGLSE